MKLTTIVYAFVVAGFLLVLAAFGFFSHAREVRQFEDDMKRDAQLLGGAVASAASDAWKTGGEPRVRELISRANAGESLIHVRWVWLDHEGAAGQDPPRIPLAELSQLSDAHPIAYQSSGTDVPRGIYTYVALRGPSGERSALELFEPLDTLDAYTRASAKNLAITAAALVLLGALVVAVVGYRVVGKRMLSLVQQARQIGAGDLTSRVNVHGSDEIAELGEAMNQMATHLEDSREELAAEARSRIAAVEQLQHSERVATLGQLSAGMAHELGTPLNVISGRAKLITTDPAANEEVSDSSRIIAEQADRMTGIIRQFLEYGRRSESRRGPEDLQQIVSHVLELLKPMARDHGVSVHLADGSVLPQVEVDRSQMQQVCMNLIRNGIQAMPDGGNLEVVVDRERARPPSGGGGRECAAIVVRDEGVGIPEDQLGHIFEPFFSTKSAGQGTGLGLAIVAAIVEDYDGWLAVESEVGKGSSIRVYLPLKEGK